ncbi:hypothetical protein [Actinacidiphila yeochonensis]|uniref:hypothetical protein n=1 Tax=Actinacidiphila yeochonensis TaxID=89050 RepID=UPI00068F8196|nr:hypothetical protein [Actinacidiphila yeochonensis]
MSERSIPPPGAPQGMDRRSLLRAAGLGAGVVAVGASAGGVAAATRGSGTAGAADVTDVADSARMPLLGGVDFPIGIFWPPHPFQASEARYREITDAGFTFMITGNYQLDEASTRQALSLADQVGLKVLVAGDPRVNALAQHLTVTDDRSVASSITTADAASWVRDSVAAYSSYASFAGFNVYDEPARSRFANVGAVNGVVRSTAPTLLPYANINRGNGAAYRDFVRSYVAAARPSVLSFDRYPFLTTGLDSAYFETWAIVRAAALQAGIPAWTYIQSTGFSNHPVPTASQLAWQVNTSLAYGCKGIQYFTYWTPDPARGEGYTEALITTDGRRTPLYDAATVLNTGWLQPVGRQLKPLVSESVQHANDAPLPVGTTAFAPGAYLSAVAGDAAIVGLFSDPRDSEVRYLLVTNRDPDRSATVRVTPDAGNVAAVAGFDPGKGTYGALPAGQVTVRLAAGGAALYRLTSR